MSIVGLRTSENFATNTRPENWREGILMLYPNSANARSAMLTGLTSKMKTEKTDDAKFHWFDKVLNARQLELGATITAGATTFAIVDNSAVTREGANALSVVEGTLLYSQETGEIVMVSADPTTATSLSVVRGYSGTTGTALDITVAGTNTMWTVIGSAYEENSHAPSGQSFDPTDHFNYTQIFRKNVEISGTADATKLRTGPAYKEAKREALEYLGIDMERAFFFGGRSLTTKNGRPLRTTQGIKNFIPAGNELVAPSGQLNMNTFEEWLALIFAFGSEQKVLMGGNGLLLALNQVVRKNTSYQIFSGEKEYGINVTKFVCPFGELVFMSHPLFTQERGGTTGGTAFYGMNNKGFVLDMANFKYRPLEGRDVKLIPDQQVPGQDGKVDGWLAECGLEVHHADTHFFIDTVSAGIADA